MMPWCRRWLKLCEEAKDSLTSIGRWEKLTKKAQLWSDLNKFGDVHATVDWDIGPVGQCVHDAYRLTLRNTKKLEQANKRPTNREVDECQSQFSSISDACSPAAAPAVERLGSSLELTHGKTKCVWCGKTVSAKHPKSKLGFIS